MEGAGGGERTNGPVSFGGCSGLCRVVAITSKEGWGVLVSVALFAPRGSSICCPTRFALPPHENQTFVQEHRWCDFFSSPP